MEVRVRVAAIIIEKKKILLQKGIGYFELWTPGGKIKLGETDEQALKRELHEKMGVTLESATFYKEYIERSLYVRDQMSHTRCYIVTIQGKPVAQERIEKIVWLSKEDYATKKHPLLAITQNKIIPDLIKDGIF